MAATHPLLEPYEPSAHDPFDRVKAAHLLNRAGFGGTPEEIEKVLRLGPSAAVDWLLDFPDQSAEEQDKQDVPDLSSIADLPKSFRDLRQMYAGKTRQERMAINQRVMGQNREAMVATWGWWLQRMARGPHPMQEKLAFFWHGHFTTSYRDERMALLMWEQNELIRRQVAGNFGAFVHAISRDPAMLDYLNNTQNRRGHPNENYAREVMELFTLGIGNYTEADVKEAARAFTGWTHDGDRYLFNAFQHDAGAKTVLGKTGNFNGDDVLDLLLAQPACPKFIASKLFAYFVYPDPQEELIEGLGQLFRDVRLELRPLLRTVFTSKAFYSDKAIGVQIKSPVQFVIGTIRQLGVDMPPFRALFGPLQMMGQVPMMPPNVKGWPGGRTWINASTLFARCNTAMRLASEPLTLHGLPDGANDPGVLVDALVDPLIQRPIDSDKRQVLVDAASSHEGRHDRIQYVVQLIVSMPEYQLC
ncbi:MAG TPA: DUF1800 domain-containing protein [Tepidisphaeraceae bacterium]|jgi:uncharacterized protein (DUF1800 family)